MNDDLTMKENSDETIIEKDKYSEKEEKRSYFHTPKIKDYLISKQLNSKSGEADLFLISRGGEEFILKLYRFGFSPKNDIVSKLKELSNITNSKIVRVIEFSYDKESGRYYEIMDYIKNGSMKDYIKEHKFSIEEIKKIVYDMFLGLKVLHKNGILHLDIKPSNILVKSFEPIEILFTDFGISSVLDPDFSKKMTEVKGTPMYWAPESISGVVGKAADYWAVGIIVYELYFGKNPFDGLDTKVVLYNLTTRGVEIDSNIDKDIYNVLIGLLKRDPEERWGEIELERWFVGKDESEHKTPIKLENTNKSPFVLNDKVFYTLAEIAEYSIENYEQFIKIRRLIGEGILIKWLKENFENKTILKFENIMDSYIYSENIAMVEFIYSFSEKNIPFMLYGKVITLKNILIYAKRVLNKEASIAEEAVILEAVECKIGIYFQKYCEIVKREDRELSLIETVEQDIRMTERTSAKGLTYYDKLEILIKDLLVLLEIEKYYFPPAIVALVKDEPYFFLRNRENLITEEKYKEIEDNYILPDEFNEFDSLMKYENFLKMVSEDKKIFLSRREYEELNEKYLLPADMKNINTCTLENYKKNIEFIEKNRDRFIEKIEYEEIKSKSVDYWIINEVAKVSIDDYLKCSLFLKNEKRSFFSKAEFEILGGDKYLCERVNGIVKSNLLDLKKSFKAIGEIKAEIGLRFFKAGEIDAALDLYYDVSIISKGEMNDCISPAIDSVIFSYFEDKNYGKILEIIKRAEELRITLAQEINNILFSIGENYLKNGKSEAAMECFGKIHGEKRSRAEYKVGLFYFENKNYLEAYKRISVAAHMGNIEAIYLKGVMCEEGLGAIKNSKRAKKLFEIAKLNGHELAAERYKKYSGFLSGFNRNNKIERNLVFSEIRYGIIGEQGLKLLDIKIINNSKKMLTLFDDNRIRLEELERQDARITIYGGERNITAIEEAGEDLIAAAYDDGRVKLWSISKREIVKTFETEFKKITTIKISPDKKLLLCGGFPEIIVVFSLEEDKVLKELRFDFRNPLTLYEKLPPVNSYVNDIDISYDSKMAAVVANHSYLRIWDIMAGEMALGMDTGINGNLSVAVSGDMKRVCAAGVDGYIIVYDTISRTIKSSLNEDGVNVVAFAIDSKVLFSGNKRGILKAWNTKTGELLREIDNFGASIIKMAFSDDGNLLVCGLISGIIKVMDIDVIEFN